MATWNDVRRIALSLPETSEKTSASGTVTWSVRDKSFAWERPLRRGDLEALGDAAPTGPILGLRTADLEMKDVVLASDPTVFFTTPHFDGYAAVLVRLGAISPAALRAAMIESWLARAPKRVADAFVASNVSNAGARKGRGDIAAPQKTRRR
jgi:hypothetical protein